MFKLNAKLVRRMMIERGLSLRQLAMQAGLNTATAGKLIRDGATASLKTIGVLAKFFNVDGDELILAS